MGSSARIIKERSSWLKMSIAKSYDDISAELNQACDLTQQIVELAEAIKLDDVDALNNRRLALIDSIFSNDKNKIDLELAQQLLSLNTQATKVLEQQMTLNMQQQQKQRKGNAAHSAYMRHSA